MGEQPGKVLPEETIIAPKSFTAFIERMSRRSESTGRVYGQGIRLLASFLQKPHPNDTVPITTKLDPYQVLDGYVGWLLREGYSANSVLAYVGGVKSWLWYNGVEVYNEKLRRFVELPQPEEALDDAPTKKMLREILQHLSFRMQSQMLLLSCSGVRPVDMRFLKPSDFKWEEHPVRLIVPPKGKTKRGWETFITDELAVRLRQDPYFFRPKGGKWGKNLRVAFYRGAKKANCLIEARVTERGKRLYKYHLYSLKKFFESNVTMAHGGDRSFALAWEGRKAYLDNYLRLTLEQRQQLYLKAMPHLTIFTEEPTKPKDLVVDRLKKHGLSEETIAKVLEGLVLA